MFRLTTAFLTLTLLITSIFIFADEPVVKRNVEPSDIADKDETLYNPAHSVIYANKDALSLAAADVDTSTIRYISAYNFPKARRKEIWETVSYVIHSLSSDSPKMYPPVIVPDTDGTLLRVDLSDYGIDPKQFENLANKGSGPAEAAIAEPYFNVDEIKADKTTTRKFAKWIPTAEITSLSKVTHSDNPILRADWFIAYASISPAYYDLLNLGKKEADFQELALFDEKIAKKARSATKGVVIKSNVSLHNRALIRFPTASSRFHGYYWESNDFKKSSKGADTMANLLKQKVDAKELIATLRNGLQAYFIVNGNGDRVDFADPQIVRDKESKWDDFLIYAGRNCMQCHSMGIRTISDRVRNTLQAAPNGKIELLIPYTLKKEKQEVDEQFLSIDIAEVVKFDNAIYAAAVKACNGLDPTTNGTQFEAFSYNYLDRMITIEIAAMEAGITVDKLKMVLSKSTNIDHSLTAFLAKPPHNTTRRDHWEAKGFAQMMLLIQQYDALEKK